ncbi:MAG: cytidylate kinase-like family protein [Verrucomicrobiaceae bacterium]|nr:MAG: cytidylate kinase-like family protein [Verrucomicrobiaceae bacterium]
MSKETYTDLCRAYLYSSTASEHRAARPAVTEGPVITISRAAGTRGTTIAEALVERLHNDRTLPRRRPWTLFDQNLIQHVITEHQLPEKTAEYFPEDKSDEIRATIAELFGLHHGVYTTMVKTAETIRSLAKAGNVVIVGRGGNLITADIALSLHVRLVGSADSRVRHYARKSGLSHAAAAAEIARIDRGRKRYIKQHFKCDIDDPLGYDLVINTDEFDNKQAVNVMLCAIHQKLG